MLSKPNICYTEREATRAREALKNTEGHDRIFGSRIITILYQGKEINISEGTVVGSPAYQYEVNPDLSSVNQYQPLSAFKRPGKIYTLMYGSRVELDFTGREESSSAKQSYKELYGKLFVFKRCQV